MAEDQVDTETIAEDGDIILVIGKPVAARLLVHRATLERSSPVFKALLSSKWREGQTLGTANSPQEIELPEDEAGATSHMCNLLHGSRAALSTASLASEQIFKLSVVVDKYGCAEALYYQSQAILLMWLDKTPIPKMTAACYLTAASYLLDQPRAFQTATRRLAKNISCDYAPLLQLDCGKVLTAKVFTAYNKISTELPLLGMPTCTICNGNSNSASAKRGTQSINYDSTYMDQLCNAFKVSIWPPDFRKTSCSVFEAKKKIHLIGTGQGDAATCTRTGSKDEITAQALEDFAEGVTNLCKGLCLHCVKQDHADLLSECQEADHKQKTF